MEELTDNAEEQEDEGSKQSEQKLGKLQYKVSGESNELYVAGQGQWTSKLRDKKLSKNTQNRHLVSR